jgi:hypothetical protein
VILSCLAGSLRSCLKQRGVPFPEDVTVYYPLSLESSNSLRCFTSFNIFSLPVGTEGMLRNFEMQSRLLLDLLLLSNTSIPKTWVVGALVLKEFERDKEITTTIKSTRKLLPVFALPWRILRLGSKAFARTARLSFRYRFMSSCSWMLTISLSLAFSHWRTGRVWQSSLWAKAKERRRDVDSCLVVFSELSKQWRQHSFIKSKIWFYSGAVKQPSLY